MCMTLRQGNTKLRLYEAACAWLVWTVHDYHLPYWLNLVCTMHKATASSLYLVHTTQVEAASYGLGVASPQVWTRLNVFKAVSTLEQKCARGRPRRGMRSNVDV